MKNRPSRIVHLATSLSLVAALSLAAAPALAIAPPGQIHYQGVLRDLTNHPLTGTYNMTLRLWNAASGGDEIMIDAHTGGSGVAVSGGEFLVELGGGAVSDGFSPGIYTSLADVFRDFDVVYLEVTVGADTLAPRTRIIAAASALNSLQLAGRRASSFLDTSPAAQSKPGRLTVDDASSAPGNGLTIQSAGTAALFGAGKTTSGQGWLGYGDVGVWGAGNYSGGYFQSRAGTGSALVGYGHTGIQGDGRALGGSFSQSDFNGLAQVAQDGLGGSFYGTGNGAAFTAYHDFGIQTRGRSPGAGAYFYDPSYSGIATCGSGDNGIIASGTYQGGDFHDQDGSGHARIGYGGTGVYGVGSYAEDNVYGAGGYFADVSGPGQAWLGWGSVGAAGYGDIGGDFGNMSSSFPRVDAASGQRGITAFGSYIGASHLGHIGFSGYNNIAWTPYHEPVNGGNYSVFGFEPKAFVQNHPADPGRSVVYVAIEGDEAGTYTRGQARLRGGVAHVRLDRSFALATNPDVGLTAGVTPVKAAVTLSVESLTADELVVRGPKGNDDVVFDYAVFGLRIGFETHPTVIERPVEGAPHLASDFKNADDPGADQPLARWSAVRTTLGGTTPLDLSRTDDLIALARRPGKEPPDGGQAHGGAIASRAAAFIQPPATVPVPVAGSIHAADLLATDPIEAGGSFVSASAAAGQTVIGIAAADASDVPPGAGTGRTAPLALAGSIVACHVDATSTPIAPGDLLVASTLPGHAMRAPDRPAPGTVFARALEPLSGGTGTILVRVVSQ
jgi:hypothetical protein